MVKSIRELAAAVRERLVRIVRLVTPSPRAAVVPLGSRPIGATDVELLEWNRDNCSWPRLYYSSTREFLRACGAVDFVEVGVAYGYHAEFLLAGLPGLRYTGVDPYIAGYVESDNFTRDVAALFSDDPTRAMDRLHDAVVARLTASSGGRARVVRAPSVIASRQIADESLDAVFVDGNHLYEPVLDDLRAWWPRLRAGGVMFGDDYGIPGTSRAWPGVSQAWDEFIGDHGLTAFFVVNPDSGYVTIAVTKPD